VVRGGAKGSRSGSVSVCRCVVRRAHRAPCVVNTRRAALQLPLVCKRPLARSPAVRCLTCRRKARHARPSSSQHGHGVVSGQNGACFERVSRVERAALPARRATQQLPTSSGWRPHTLHQARCPGLIESIGAPSALCGLSGRVGRLRGPRAGAPDQVPKMVECVRMRQAVAASRSRCE
jgi:hypothetical protein